jgi:hypothetical protein
MKTDTAAVTCIGSVELSLWFGSTTRPRILFDCRSLRPIIRTVSSGWNVKTEMR